MPGTLNRIRVLSRHPSHNLLRETLSLLPFKAVVRFGSTTEVSPDYIECNTIKAIKNCKDKFLMKDIFRENNIRSPEHVNIRTLEDYERCYELGNKLVIKRRFHSRGRGMFLIEKDRLKSLKETNIIIERYYNYSREYRLHCTQERCFHVLRKLRKNDATERWFFNRSNCIFKLEFKKPDNWEDIERECTRAIKCLELDIGSLDVRVAKDGRFTILEVNSAPSLGRITTEKYRNEILKILNKKHEAKSLCRT